MHFRSHIVVSTLVAVCCVRVEPSHARGGNSTFVNFETPQVHPLALTQSGSRLLAANTADYRLEVFDVSSAPLTICPSDISIAGGDGAVDGTDFAMQLSTRGTVV